MKRIIITLILLLGYANFVAQAQNTEFSRSASGIWFEVRTDSLNPCRNPFPYIQYPITKGKTWKWRLTIGSQWGDERWTTWEGLIVNKYKYKITETNCEVVTLMGTLSCVKVEAVAKSRIGKSFFNCMTELHCRHLQADIDQYKKSTTEKMVDK